MSKDYPRDLVGYGESPPDPRWPNGAKIALQFVINYEEGGESSVLHGDDSSEKFLSEIVGAEAYPDRHLSMESLYEYGSRAGFWRLHRLFVQQQIPVTVFAVATALEKNPQAVTAMKSAGWEIASHGLKWIHYQHFSRQEEKAHIDEAIRIHQQVTGSKPLGWYTGRTSPYTLELIAERDDILYCADSYADDLPYWDNHYSKPLLMVPYTLDTNDMRFATPQGFNSGEQFYQYLKDAFDELYFEGEVQPKMLSIGLHCRIVGRPARLAALRRFINYTKQFDHVWYATRQQIAQHWLEQHPQHTNKSEKSRQESQELNIQQHNLVDISFASPASVNGELSGISLSVKDLFAVKGFKTGAGLPAWLENAKEEKAHAEVISLLLEQGVRLTYKTQLDEFAYSLAGNNSHYGVSPNPHDRTRTSGGSSSGAAVSVVLDEADLALATDTGGSIRVPASYCGLFGIRPTYGAISTKGLVPLAPLFDTPGLMSKSLTYLATGLKAILQHKEHEALNSLAWCEALWDGVESDLKEKAEAIFTHFSGHKTRLDAPPLNAEQRRYCFSVLQANSIWQTHGMWLSEHLGDFGEEIQARLKWGQSLTPLQKSEANILLEEWSENKSRWLPKGCVLIMPTVPGVAPRLDSKSDEVEEQRKILLSLTAIAGLSGWPQLQLPCIEKEGLPIGISLLSGENSDLSLIQFAQHFQLDRLNG